MCECVKRVCVCVSVRAASSLGLELEPASVWLASVCRLPRAHTHIHTYTFRQAQAGSRRGGGGGRDQRVCKSLGSQLERGIGRRCSLNALFFATPSRPTCLADSHFLFISLGHELAHCIPPTHTPPPPFPRYPHLSLACFSHTLSPTQWQISD